MSSCSYRKHDRIPDDLSDVVLQYLSLWEHWEWELDSDLINQIQSMTPKNNVYLSIPSIAFGQTVFQSHLKALYHAATDKLQFKHYVSIPPEVEYIGGFVAICQDTEECTDYRRIGGQHDKNYVSDVWHDAGFIVISMSKIQRGDLKQISFSRILDIRQIKYKLLHIRSGTDIDQLSPLKKFGTFSCCIKGQALNELQNPKHCKIQALNDHLNLSKTLRSLFATGNSSSWKLEYSASHARPWLPTLQIVPRYLPLNVQELCLKVTSRCKIRYPGPDPLTVTREGTESVGMVGRNGTFIHCQPHRFGLLEEDLANAEDVMCDIEWEIISTKDLEAIGAIDWTSFE